MSGENDKGKARRQVVRHDAQTLNEGRLLRTSLHRQQFSPDVRRSESRNSPASPKREMDAETDALLAKLETQSLEGETDDE